MEEYKNSRQIEHAQSAKMLEILPILLFAALVPSINTLSFELKGEEEYKNEQFLKCCEENVPDDVSSQKLKEFCSYKRIGELASEDLYLNSSLLELWQLGEESHRVLLKCLGDGQDNTECCRKKGVGLPLVYLHHNAYT